MGTQPGAQLAGMVDVSTMELHHHAVGSHVTGMGPGGVRHSRTYDSSCWIPPSGGWGSISWPSTGLSYQGWSTRVVRCWIAFEVGPTLRGWGWEPLYATHCTCDSPYQVPPKSGYRSLIS